MPDETMHEDGREMDTEHDGIPGMPPFPDDMPEELRQQFREAHARGGLGAMLLGALVMGRPDPDEEMRQGVRRAMDLTPDETPVMGLRFALSTAVRTDGSEIMLASALLNNDNDEDAMVEARDFLQKIVVPVLRPGEGVRVRMLDFSLGTMVECATKTYTLPEFEEHVLLMQADSEHEARVAKFEECEDCDDEDCDRRITERPTREGEPAE